MYSLDWYTEGVLRLKLEGDVSLDDVANFNNELLAHYDAASEPLIVIFDGSNTTSMPTNIHSVNARNAAVMSHPQLGRFLFVGFESNPVMKFMINVVGKSNQAQYDLLRDYEQVNRRLAQLGMQVG